MLILKRLWVFIGDERLALIMAGVAVMNFVADIINANLIEAIASLLFACYLINVNWPKLGVANEISKS